MGSTNPTLIVSSPDEDNPRTYDAYDSAIDDYYGAPDSVNDNPSIYHAPRYAKSRSNRPPLPPLDTSERHINHMHKNPNEEQISFDQHRPTPRSRGSPTMSPSSPTATAATAVMAQEMSAVQALKRLSIGALPTLDPDLPNYNESSSNPSSPIRGSPASSPRTDSTGFDFTSPKSPNSLQVPKEGQHHQPGINASQASQLLWVPAHVHPEIAPQQWKSFVQDKLAEIRATQSSDSLSRSSSTSSTSSIAMKRRNSRLSRQIEDQDGYTDGADVLEKRRSSDNLLQKATDPTIQSLSNQLESLGELEGWSVDPYELVRSLSMQKSSNPYSPSSTSPTSEYPTAPLANDSDTPILPAPTSSLRRSTKTRINKSSIRRGRRDIAASRTHTSESSGLSEITSPVDKKPPTISSMESAPVNPSKPSTTIPSILPSTPTTHSNLPPKQVSPSTPTDPERSTSFPPTPSAPPQSQPQPQPQQRPRTRHSPERKPVQRVRIPITNKPLSECPELPPNRRPSGRTRPPEPSEPVKSSVVPQQQDISKAVEPPRQKEGPRRKEPATSQMSGIVGNDYDNVPKLINQQAQQQQSKPKRPTMKRQTGSLSSTGKIMQRTDSQLEKQAGTEIADQSELKPSPSLSAGRRGPKSPTAHGEPHQTQPMQPIEHPSNEQMHIDSPVEIKPENKVEAMPVNQKPVVTRPNDRRVSAENRPSEVDEEGSVPSQPHSRAKTRKGTWGWLFNGAAGGSYSGSGKSSPGPQEKQSSRPGSPAVPGPVSQATPSTPPVPKTPEPSAIPFSSEAVDKAAVDKFLNRAPVSETKNEPLYTTTLQTAQSPELVVTTIDDGEVSSQKVSHSSSSSISETKDRISNFFSKKKSIANLKAQKYGDSSSDHRGEDQEGLRPDSYTNSRSPSPNGDFKSIAKSQKAISKPRNRSKNRDKTRARYRSRSRHQSPERPEPVQTQQQHQQQYQQKQQQQQQLQQQQQQAPIQNLPNGIPGPTTNAAGFVTYSAEAAAYYGAPYQIPAHQYSDKSMYMMNHRYAPHIERAIYRLSHLKLGNPRRPLVQQVLLSNFMYAYLNLINQGFIRQQQEAQMQLHLQQQAQQRQITAGGQQQHEQQGQSQYMYQGGYDNQQQQQYGEQQQQEHYGAYNQDYEHEYDNQYERFANSEPAGADDAEFSYENSYKMRGTADSSSSSSSSSVAGDDMWSGDAQPKGYDDEEMFYDSHEQVSKHASTSLQTEFS